MRKRLMLPVLALLMLAALPVVAQTPEATPDPASMAHFRVVNLAADLDALDVWLDSQEAQIAGLKFGEGSRWQNVEPGEHQLAVGPAGSASNQAAIAPETLSLPGGEWTTVAVVGSQAEGTLRTSVFQQDMTELTPGVTRVTFINAVDGEPVNLLRDGVPYVTVLDFPKAYAVDEDWGEHLFEAQTGGEQPQSLATLEAENREGTYYLIALTSDGSEYQLVSVPSTSAEVAIALGTLSEPGTLVNAIDGSDLTGDLSAALDQASLTDTLAGEGPYTVFAPNGFRLDGSVNADGLATLLKNHIVEGDLLSQELVEAGSITTLGGKTYDVRVEGNTIMIGASRVVAVNLPATNGVIHIIDKPLS